MKGHHSRLRNMMGRSYPIYACTSAYQAHYLSVHVTFCGSSKHILLSNSRLRRIDSIVISADGKQLKEAQCFPYLGLIISQNLTWEDHIEHMRNKINKKLGLLRRIKSCLPLSAMITFF